MQDTLDLTPSPRVLRMLGQIEFKPWQCLAELIDNAVDSFLEGRRTSFILQPEVAVQLPSAGELRSGHGEIRIRDNGLGMRPDMLALAVKAGYSGNDPIDKLGLFGMGFNIATARLGRRSEVWTIHPDAQEWTGVVIDFDELEKEGVFSAPRLSRPRSVVEGQSHGTEIIISKLDSDRVRPLIYGQGRASLLRRLGKIYSRLIETTGLALTIDGQAVQPMPHCVWDKTRRVQTPEGPVSAIQSIHVTLDPRRYCVACWSWLEEDERVCPICGSEEALRTRPREIKGWLGIQRFFSKHHYGIDLIRNGRLIEEMDKSFFYWDNPETGESELEYPIDTTHWGGRIVGELEIDFVRVSHQKDAFDRSDPQWKHIVTAIRGDTPVRPHIGQSKGLAPNTSPIARLFAGYRRGNPPGLRWLVPMGADGKGMNEKCVEWAEKFWAGDPDYQSDAKWYEGVERAEEAKRKPAGVAQTEVDERAGESALDDEQPEEQEEEQERTDSGSSTHFRDDPALSGTFDIREMAGCPMLAVKARSVTQGNLYNGQAVRFVMQSNDAVFEYDPQHRHFTQSLETPADSLIHELAFQLLHRSRENQSSWPVTRVETQLRKQFFPSRLTDIEALAREADTVLAEMREALAEGLSALSELDRTVLDEPEISVLRNRLAMQGLAGERSLDETIANGSFVTWLSYEYLLTAINRWPEALLDGNFLSIEYAGVTETGQKLVLSRLSAILADVLWLYDQGGSLGLNRDQWREQLARAAASLRLLQLWRA